MTDPLPLTLIVVLIVLALGVLATLYQLQRTARKFEAFLEATQRDLGSITADIHAFRLHVEQLIAPLHSTTRELSDFAHALGELTQGLRRTQDRVRDGFRRVSCYLSGLTRGVTTLLPFLRK